MSDIPPDSKKPLRPQDVPAVEGFGIEPPPANYFQPEKPVWEHWKRLDLWELKQAVCLICGCDPDQLKNPSHPLNDSQPFGRNTKATKLKNVLEQAEASIAASKLILHDSNSNYVVNVDPRHFIAWARGKDISIPEELKEIGVSLNVRQETKEMRSDGGDGKPTDFILSSHFRKTEISNAPPPIKPVRGTGYQPATSFRPKSAGWDYWKKLDLWELREAVCLICNCDPDQLKDNSHPLSGKRLVNPSGSSGDGPRLDKRDPWYQKSKELWDITKLALTSIEAGKLETTDPSDRYNATPYSGVKVDPIKFMAWAKGKGFPIPDGLKELAGILGDTIENKATQVVKRLTGHEAKDRLGNISISALLDRIRAGLPAEDLIGRRIYDEDNPESGPGRDANQLYIIKAMGAEREPTKGKPKTKSGALFPKDWHPMNFRDIEQDDDEAQRFLERVYFCEADIESFAINIPTKYESDKAQLESKTPYTYVFKMAGKSVWEIGPVGNTIKITGLKGFEYIQKLLQKPGVSIPVSEIEELFLESLDVEATDLKSLQAVRNKLSEIMNEIKQTSEREKREELETEKTKYEQYLRENENLRGYARKMGPGEKQRIRVSQNIKRAINKINELSNTFGTYLKNSIKTGVECGYFTHSPETEPVKFDTGQD